MGAQSLPLHWGPLHSRNVAANMCWILAHISNKDTCAYWPKLRYIVWYFGREGREVVQGCRLLRISA